ncbi:MAG: Gfo/Idh/MocA family oxidoreductase [Rikenellaceae bacterium]|nr:Gfo/Idh/MocA family oxidoreductase [Rikenellaceae bacterium]
MSEKNKKEKGLSRRDFLKVAGTGIAAATIVPSVVLGKKAGKVAPSDKLNIAGVGVGGRGAGVLRGMDSQNIVALCDVDWKYAQKTFERYPNAKKFWDYRKMLDEMSSSIDAVMVATADHTHALVSSSAMSLGKHVYCEKPLTHTVYESRLLTSLAASQKVATQMGNQGSSGEGVRKVCDWIWNGEIGEVRKVEAFTDRPIWPQGLMRPTQVDPVPDTLNWDLFIGPAPERPFNNIYTPWNWRGWWDFGTGALGDMACHILHPVFKGLRLGYPVTAQGSSTPLLTDCAPNAQMVKLVFPERPDFNGVKMPEVEVTWYDGGLTPPRPQGMLDGKNLNDEGGGVIFYGTKDTLICGCYGVRPWLLSGREPKVPALTRKVPDDNHYMDFVRAAKENPATRIETASCFAEAGPFNEMVVMGVMAVRLQALNKTLQWDGPNMQFTNIGDSETLRIMIEDGFSIHDGHPTFNKRYTEPINAKQFANELIRHNYRNGWKLVDMPK